MVDPKHSHALIDPKLKHALQFEPQRFPITGLEIEGVDVLILFGRVLGILNRAVGTSFELTGMFDDIGMIGRALEGDIECKLNPQIGSDSDHVSEIIDRA